MRLRTILIAIAAVVMAATGVVSGPISPASSHTITLGTPTSVNTGTTHGYPSGSPLLFNGCKQTLATANTTYQLTSDIGPCRASTGLNPGIHDWGIKIAASGITLDLNGYDILGCNDAAAVTGCNAPNTTTPSDGAYTYGEGTGILIYEVDNAYVTNQVHATNPSHVRYWDQGVRIQSGATAGTCTIDNTSIAANTPPTAPTPATVTTTDGAHNTVEHLNIWDNVTTVATASPPGRGHGVYIENSDHNHIRENKVYRNGPYAAIHVDGGSEGNEIDDNDIDDNNVMTNGNQFATSGIRMGVNSDCTTVTDNTVDNSALDGIQVFAFSNGNRIEGNTVTDNGYHYDTSGNGSGPYTRLNHRLGDGIRIFSSATNTSNSNYVATNTVCGNAANGIHADNGSGTNGNATNGGNVFYDNNSGGTIAGSSVGLPSGPCGGRTEDLCEPTSGHAVFGGQGTPTGHGPCTKNDGGHDVRQANWAFDLDDKNPQTPSGTCGFNIWRSNKHGANSSDTPGRAAVHNAYFPSPTTSCVIAP